MNYHNLSIPQFKCKIKGSDLFKNNDEAFYECYAFGIQSIPGKILTFHVMTDFGMLRSRLPISSLYVGEVKNDVSPDFKMLWDCFSSNVSYTCFDYLSGKRCEVLMKDKSTIQATYLFTIDWFNNPYSDEPTDYKCGHVLLADNGYLLCQPNNRLVWRDMNFVTKAFPIDKKDIKVDTELISVEDDSSRWVANDSDSYFYDIKDNENE